MQCHLRLGGFQPKKGNLLSIKLLQLVLYEQHLFNEFFLILLMSFYLGIPLNMKARFTFSQPLTPLINTIINFKVIELPLTKKPTSIALDM